MDILEGTDEFNRGHQLNTGEIPVYTKDGFPVNGAAMDPFADDTPITATCNTEHPEQCEACD